MKKLLILFGALNVIFITCIIILFSCDIPLGNGGSGSGASGSASLDNYETGWVQCNDWTNQHLGATVGTDITHNLNGNITNILVKLVISPTGNDSDSFEVSSHINFCNDTTVNRTGFSIYNINSNSLRIQTGGSGIRYITDSDGTTTVIPNNWYYKIIVVKLF